MKGMFEAGFVADKLHWVELNMGEVHFGRACCYKISEAKIAGVPLVDWQSYAKPRNFVDANPRERLLMSVGFAEAEHAVVVAAAAAEDVENVAAAGVDSVVLDL